MRSPVLKLAGALLCSACAALWALACDDDGTTTSCEEMPVADADAAVPSSDPDVKAWWARAADERCATPPIGGFSGAAGAPN